MKGFYRRIKMDRWPNECLISQLHTDKKKKTFGGRERASSVRAAMAFLFIKVTKTRYT